jgi:hypothetical protein
MNTQRALLAIARHGCQSTYRTNSARHSHRSPRHVHVHRSHHTRVTHAPARVTASGRSPTSDSIAERRPRHPSPPHTGARRRRRGHTATPSRAWHTSRRTTRTRAAPPSHTVSCQRHDCAATRRIPAQDTAPRAMNSHALDGDSKRAMRDAPNTTDEPHRCSHTSGEHQARPSTVDTSNQPESHHMDVRCQIGAPGHSQGMKPELNSSSHPTHNHTCQCVVTTATATSLTSAVRVTQLQRGDDAHTQHHRTHPCTYRGIQLAAPLHRCHHPLHHDDAATAAHGDGS